MSTMGNVGVAYERADEVGWGGEGVFFWIMLRFWETASPNPTFCF